MKILLFFIFTGLLFSCSSQDNTKDNPIKSKTVTDETTLNACEICILQTKLSNLERQEIEFKVRKLNDCQSKLLSKVKSEKDSLSKIIKELLSKNNLDYNMAESKCSTVYPANKIKDDAKADSLFYDLEYWYGWISLNRPIYEIIDTICGKSQYYADGKYGLKSKGEMVLLTKEEYENYCTKYAQSLIKIETLIDKKINDIILQLTGITNPDQYCLEIMRRNAANHMKQYYKNGKKWRQVDDGKEIKELISSIYSYK